MNKKESKITVKFIPNFAKKIRSKFLNKKKTKLTIKYRH